MDKFLEVFKKLLEKFKNLSKGVKIASIISAITLIIAISSLFFYQSSNKYSVLFSLSRFKNSFKCIGGARCRF